MVPSTTPNDGFDLNELIEHLYQGPLETNLWASFLQCLRLRLNCDIAAISLRLARPGIKAITLWGRAQPPTLEQENALAKVWTSLAHLNPLSNALREPGDIFTLDEVIDRETLTQSDYYQKIIKPWDIEYQLGMYLAGPHGWICQIGLLNSASRNNFGATEKRLLLALRPHIERALQLYAEIKRNELERDIYEDALNRLTIGAIILDGRGKVIEINQTAHKIIKKTHCLSIEHDEVICNQARYRADLALLIRQAIDCCRQEIPRTFISPLRIQNLTGTTLDVLVRSAPVSPWYQNDISPSVIIYLNDMTLQQSVPEQHIGLLLGLTPAEAHFAVMLANGHTVSAAAKMMNLTENSARTYSKNIFAKLGISRQVDLVRLVLRSVALLGGTNTGDT